MKCFYIAVCFVIVSVGLCEAKEQPIATPYSWEKYNWDYELNGGLGIAKDCNSGDYWKFGQCGGFGANFIYTPIKRVRLRTGISEQVYSSSRYVEHPYPYVMDMKLRLSTISTRIIAGGEIVFPRTQYHQTSFLGVGFYGDVVHYARVSKWLNYISSTKLEPMNVKDSFKAITPGFMVNIGLHGSKIRVDVRYMQDFTRFDLPDIPIGKQRRTYIGLNLPKQRIVKHRGLHTKMKPWFRYPH
ncbi:MAG: hypothetical protein PHY48_05105 [Candidatus Cloacimonetes bacterium]|nr:hypothetical protein [Candidatus Cloacimonadota bacterium]